MTKQIYIFASVVVLACLAYIIFVVQSKPTGSLVEEQLDKEAGSMAQQTQAATVSSNLQSETLDADKLQVKTSKAAFALNRNEEAPLYYKMEYDFTAPLIMPVYVQVEFEHTQPGQPAVMVEEIVPAGKMELSVNSPYFAGIVSGQHYDVTLNVYTDEQHNTLITKHTDSITFKMPEERMARFGITPYL